MYSEKLKNFLAGVTPATVSISRDQIVAAAQKLGLENISIRLPEPVEEMPWCPWVGTERGYEGGEYTLTMFQSEARKMASEFVAALRERGLVD